jgi:hypothetical protein
MQITDVTGRWRIGARVVIAWWHITHDMNAFHATHAASLLFTSFGAGVGLVTVAIVLNVIVEGLRRLKRGPIRPAMTDNDVRRLVQPGKTARRAPDGGRMPMVTFRRQG